MVNVYEKYIELMCDNYPKKVESVRKSGEEIPNKVDDIQGLVLRLLNTHYGWNEEVVNEEFSGGGYGNKRVIKIGDTYFSFSYDSPSYDCDSHLIHTFSLKEVFPKEKMVTYYE